MGKYRKWERVSLYERELSIARVNPYKRAADVRVHVEAVVQVVTASKLNIRKTMWHLESSHTKLSEVMGANTTATTTITTTRYKTNS